MNRYYVLDDRSIEAAVAEFAPRLSGTLLDLGAGDRPYEAVVRPFVTRYLAMEPAPGARSASVVGDGRALPFRSNSLDAVLCTQVLEHVAEPSRVLGEVARVLKPGGQGLVTVPMNAGVHLAPHDYFRFTEFALRHLCRDAGLEPVVVRERGGRVLSAAQALILIFEVDAMPRRSLGAALARRAIRAVVALIERAAPWLDRRFPRRGNPLGYVALLRKPAA